MVAACCAALLLVAIAAELAWRWMPPLDLLTWPAHRLKQALQQRQVRALPGDPLPLCCGQRPAATPPPVHRAGAASARCGAPGAGGLVAARLAEERQARSPMRWACGWLAAAPRVGLATWREPWSLSKTEQLAAILSWLAVVIGLPLLGIFALGWGEGGAAVAVGGGGPTGGASGLSYSREPAPVLGFQKQPSQVCMEKSYVFSIGFASITMLKSNSMVT